MEAIYFHLWQDVKVRYWFAFFGIVHIFAFMSFYTVVYPYLLTGANIAHQTILSQLDDEYKNKKTSKEMVKVLKHGQSFIEESKKASNTFLSLINGILTLYTGFTAMNSANLQELHVQNSCDTSNVSSFTDVMNLNIGYTLVDTIYLFTFQRNKES